MLSSDLELNGDEPIAIIGLAYEFPQGATTEESFWQMILDGRSASTEFPPDRMNIDAFYHPDANRPSSIPLRGGHFVQESLGTFDAPFFSITPEEAACMDPQHRRLLETTYLALEDAGIPISKCSGSNTSVYTGCFTNDYLSILQQDYNAEQRHAAMGIAPSMLANRLSWFFNFKGTSMNLDSACSSSLIALHLACQDLRAKSSEMAVVGGANLVYHPNFMKIMSNFNFLSRDSRCWSFDKRANGYARGEGSAVILLKRLDAALRDGDTVRAVIRNTGSNQDGRTPGITQPSESAQIDLIRKTYQHASIDMAPTRFFEAHATGTPVGDPIEGNAIGTAFQEYRSENDPLYIGAIKANIGHLEGCSGLAGIIKATLVLEKGIIPPIANFESLNDRIDAKRLHLHFPTEAVPWPEVSVRRACVNSFGFGGTNAVAILDDAYHYFKLNDISGFHRTQLGVSLEGNLGSPNEVQPNGVQSNGVNEHELNVNGHAHTEATPTNSFGAIEKTTNREKSLVHEPKTARLLVWSASDQRGVQQLSKAYKSYLSSEMPDMDNLVYTLAIRRSHFKWRSFSVVSSRDQEFITSDPVKATTEVGGIAFIFTGQGAQYLGMGRQLLAYSVFRNSLTQSNDCLRQLGCQWSLLDIMSGRSDIDIDRPEYSQPLTTCLQLALVDLLRSFAIVPSLVLGHSSGEIAAAYASGILPSHSAIKIAYWRGQLSAQLTRQVQGLTMMAVGLSNDQAITYLNQLQEADGELNVAVGCVNSPNSVTLTGKVDQLSKLEISLKEKGIFAQKLRVHLAYHSCFMNPIAEDYRTALDGLQMNQDSGFVPMISSVTGDVVTAMTVASPAYWIRNLTLMVEFEAAFSKLVAVSNRKARKQLGRSMSANRLALRYVLEVGPHGALQGPIREGLKAFDGTNNLSYIATLNRAQDASHALLNAVGMLHSLGYPVDLLAANGLDDSLRPAPAYIPRYPFNHSTSYWKEGQLSRNFRFNSSARHDLLGTRSLDWNPMMAQWRNVMRLNELPWLEDHTIGGEVVLPAAGMVSMAVEGLTQLLDNNVSSHGIDIKNVLFSHATSFPRGVDYIETQLTLSRPSQSSDPKPWSHFRLFVLENGSYIECCSGLIRAVIDAQDRHSVISSGPWMRHGTLENWIVGVDEACKGPEIDAYDLPEGVAVRYGPSFQTLERLRLGTQGEAIAHVNTETWRLKTSGPAEPSFVINPVTLDSLAQPLLQALRAQKRGIVSTMVPVRVARIWIDGNNTAPGKLKVAARCSFRGYRGGSANVVATAIDSGKALIFLEGLETSFISSAEIDNPEEAARGRILCTKLTWKPDIETMSREQVLHHCIRGRPQLPATATQDYLALMVAILCFVQDTIVFIENHPDIKRPWHLETYIGWLRYQQERLENGKALVTKQAVQQILVDGKARERLVSEIENSGVDGFFFMQIGRNLTKMLSGEIDPLAFMFHDGLADRYYEKMLANDHHAYPASQYIDLLSFKNPSMKILEVGAGTGGQTLRLLETMSSDGVQKWAQYDYTDISPSFFTQARIKFCKYVKHMQFKVCDISKDPTLQSFDEGSYDLVVASHVLHATDDLDQSLRHIQKLLKPNGKLLLFETTRPEALQVGFAFGLLTGWWNPTKHEERSPHSPCLDVAQWDIRLKLAGFTGVEVEIPGQEEPVCRYSSIIVSSVARLMKLDKASTASLKINLVVDDVVEAQRALAKLLESLLPDVLGVSCKTFNLTGLAKASGMPESSVAIFLKEVDAVFLDGISEEDYQDLQAILVQTKNVIWVTRANSSEKIDPRHHLVLGLGRTLMSEDSSYKFVTLSVDKHHGNEEHIANAIYELTQRIVKLPVEDLENNYVASEGTLQICRVTEHAEMNTKVAQAIVPRQKLSHKLTTEAPVVELHLGLPGHLDTLEWKEVDDQGCRDATSLGSDEVVVQVRAFGLTFRDFLVASGQLDGSGLSTDCSGIVQAAGENSGCRIGDRVCLIAPSTSCTFVRTTASAVVAIPPYMSFEEGASIPSALWLSYRAVVDVARAEKGETVLIHHASSCIGQMTVQLAQRLGVHILTTVTSPSGPRGALLREQLMIPETDIFDAEDGSATSKIFRRTNGAGVNIIIGPLSNGGHRVALDFSVCLAPFGRLIDISLLQSSDVVSGPQQNGNKALPNISRASIDMIDLIERKPSLAHTTFQRAAKMAFGLNLKNPHPLHVFGAGDIEAAFRHFSSPESLGRRVVKINPDTEIMANMKTKPKYNFRPDATYVIAGGLGGLGRSFARWMVSRGARNLILLSRSGATGIDAKALVAELSSQGVCVATPAIDISNLSKLKNEIEGLREQMPPIAGCIQATVALRDNLFPNMSYDDWVIGTGTKATGSWNLHTVLPSGLDFFVLLASLNGIVGGRAQANYAAGNTFKDALAHHRLLLGEKAVSIDLGLMVSEGMVAKNDVLLANMRRLGHLMDISQDELIAILDYYCDPDLPLLSHDKVQILVGLETPAAVQAKGIDLHHSIYRPLFRQFFRMDLSSTDAEAFREQNLDTDRGAVLRSLTSDEQATNVVTSWLVAKIAHILGLDVSEVDSNKPVHTYGIDSLVAIDLKNWFAREIKAEIQVFLLLGNTPIREVAREAVVRSAYRQ